MLQAVHQVVESLPLLVDDFPVICQGVEQSLSLRDYQTPAEIRSRDRIRTILCTWVTGRQANTNGLVVLATETQGQSPKQFSSFQIQISPLNMQPVYLFSPFALRCFILERFN